MKNQGYITEKNEIPIVDQYDIIVVGGGIAAVGAALAARRNGYRVLIIEKSVILGGLATLGFIAYYLPLCDGKGKKVTGGIAEELLHLSIKYGYNDLPEQWLNAGGVGTKKRYTTIFSPPEFVFAMDELMESENIDVLFDTVFCRPVMKEDVCEAVIVENKSGRLAYQAKMFIDATGDADLICRAGADYVEEENYLAYWFYNTNLEKMKLAVQTGDIKKGISLEWRGKFNVGGGYDLGEKEFKGSDAWDITRFVLKGRKILKEQIEDNQKNNGSIIAIPGMAQFRRTRRIAGLYELKESDAFKHFDDSIGCTGHWLKSGIVYEIPYRTMINQRHTNIFAIGRALSASGDAWEATRVIPPAVVTGQAAGTAAALCLDKKLNVQDIPIDTLQKKLADVDSIIHYSE